VLILSDAMLKQTWLTFLFPPLSFDLPSNGELCFGPSMVLMLGSTVWAEYDTSTGKEAEARLSP
jgi:hypothetical protein